MADAVEVLQRFVARHEACPGACDLVEPAEEDIGAELAHVTLRCSGCGDTVRVEVDYMARLAALASQAGIGPAEFERLSATEAGLGELARRLSAWPGMVPTMLDWARRARGGEPRN